MNKKSNIKAIIEDLDTKVESDSESLMQDLLVLLINVVLIIIWDKFVFKEHGLFRIYGQFKDT